MHSLLINHFLNNTIGISTTEIIKTSASHQSRTWFKTGGSDIAVFIAAHRKYCSDLLHIFRDLRYPRSATVQRRILLLRWS